MATAAFGLGAAPRAALASDLLGTEADLEVTRADGTQDCPNAVELLAATLALGTDASDPSGELLRITVHFARAGGGYSATIRSSGRKEGVRELARSEPTCGSVADATAVVLALLFDLVPEETPPAALPEPSLPEALPAKADDRVRPASATRATRLSLALGAQGGASYGLLGSSVAGSIAALLRPRVGRLELGLGGLLLPARSFSHGVGFVDVSLLSGRGSGCVWLTAATRPLELAACGGLLLGRLRGRGHGFFRDSSARDTFWALMLGGAARLSIGGPWALRFEPSLLLPLREYSFSLADTGRASQTARVALLLEAGAEVHFP